MRYKLRRFSPYGVERRPITGRNYHALWCLAWEWKLRGDEWTASIEDVL